MQQEVNFDQVATLLSISDFDFRLYQLLVSKGPSSVVSLSRSLKVERPTIYVALQRLGSHGLLTQTKPPFSRHVQAEPPSRLLALVEEKKALLEQERQKLEKSMPEMLAAFAAKTQQSDFRLFEGRDQFLLVFEEALREAKDEILYIGDGATFVDYVGLDYEKQWIKKRVQKKIKMRILVFKHALMTRMLEEDKNEMRQTRFMPMADTFDSSYMIYGNKTLIWNPIAERAIVLEDGIVTAMFRQIFEASWRSAKK